MVSWHVSFNLSIESTISTFLIEVSVTSFDRNKVTFYMVSDANSVISACPVYCIVNGDVTEQIVVAKMCHPSEENPNVLVTSAINGISKMHAHE